jgi:hypothetical protein
MCNIDFNQLLTYDPDTGYLYWKERRYEDFPNSKPYDVDRWNTKYAGNRAFKKVMSSGYYSGKIFGRVQLAHRVIWKLHNKQWPKGEIDHVDGNKLNNRLYNLRDVSRSKNSRNKALFLNNQSGFPGVFKTKSGRWRVKINGGSNYVNLGMFDTFEEAVQCRKEAEIKYGYHENHGRTP